MARRVLILGSTGSIGEQALDVLARSALFQLLRGEGPGTAQRLILTASGGPLRGRTDLEGVTREEALAHPTWDMGGRITIDCGCTTTSIRS